MTEKDRNQTFIENVKKTFDESVCDIDSNSLSRLAQLHQSVLESRGRYSLKWVFIPAGALAMLLLVYGLIFNSPENQVISADDIELISSSDSLEFYDELEFYEWLDEHDQST